MRQSRLCEFCKLTNQSSLPGEKKNKPYSEKKLLRVKSKLSMKGTSRGKEREYGFEGGYGSQEGIIQNS